MSSPILVFPLVFIVLIGFAYASAPVTSPSATPPNSAPKTAPIAAPPRRPMRAPAGAPKSHKYAASPGPTSPPSGRHHVRSPPSHSSGSDAGSSASDTTPADAPSSGTMLKGSAGAAIAVATYFFF